MKRRERGSAGRLEFQSQNFWVGIFVLVALGLFVAGSLTAMRERLFLREYRLRTTFTRIEGLRRGAEVLLRGYRVGEVTSIDLTTEPDVRFQVEFSVKNEVRLPRGSRVRLTTRGFGNKVLAIVTPGDAAVPDAPPPDAAAGLLRSGDFLPGDRGADMDALLGDLTLLTRRLTGTIERVDRLVDEEIGPALGSTARLLQQDVTGAVTELRGTAASARELSELLHDVVTENRPQVARLMELTGEDLEAAGDLTRAAEAFLKDLDAQVDPFFDELTATLDRTEKILSEADAAASEDQLRQIVQDLQAMADRGGELMEELKRRPWRLLRRTRREKKELLRELEEQRRRQEAGSTGDGPGR